MEPSTTVTNNEQFQREKEQFRKQIARAAEEDDPLAPYERYVAWLVKQEAHSAPAVALELLTVLEQAVRMLKDDPLFRADLRYLKLWLAYAQRVEKPDIVYVHLLRNDIGAVYVQLYEEYAVFLEQQNRLREAEEAYRLGIGRKTRAVERLKTRYREFQQRVSAKNTLKPSRNSLHIANGESSSLGAKLYRNPLRNLSIKRTSASSAPAPSPTAASAPQPSTSKAEEPSPHDSDPYAYIKAASHAAPVPGKRPEKYRFDMSLLFKDGKEYCIQEARAKSLGLLGKKWGPPPASEPGPHQAPAVKVIGLNDDGNRPPTRTLNGHMRLTTNMTASLANEPTVTINTKEALKDVFGMYNSPEKSVKMANIALGSKHAPVKKLEPLLALQPRSTLRKITEINDEEVSQGPAKGAAFRPFVDEVNKKENTTPAPPKFKPFVDENANSRTPHITPASRKAFALREVSAITPVAREKEKQKEDAQATNSDKPVFQEAQPRSVFSNVFTPISQEEKSRSALQAKGLQERPSVFRDPQQQQRSTGFSGSMFGSGVFSRPPEAKPQTETPVQNVSSAKSSARPFSLQPQGENQNEPVFHRSTSAPQRLAFTPVSRDRQPLAFAPQRPLQQPVAPEPEPEPESEPEPDIEEEEAVEDEDEDFEPQSLLDEDDGEVEEYYEDDEPHTAPMGGRFGQFDVMTPIAERTFECTMSTRAFGTPSDGSSGSILDRGLVHHDLDAAAAAEKLARELREEEAREKAKVEEVIDIEDSFEGSDLSEEEELVERTGTLSLADAIEVAGSFKPSNPCNPSDPHIVNTLLSLIPLEPEFHDLRAEVSGQFDSLQKFASKRASQLSGRRSSSRASDGAESLRVHLYDRHFKVIGKLGEGGFGAVFKAKAVSARLQSDDEGVDSDEEDDDDDDDEANFFALKVVKPRNIWEYHILRRVHSTLASPLRSSIINPHALYAYRDESFLVLDLCNQGTLLDMVNHAGDAGVLQQGACLDELLVMFFAIELIKFIEGMHATGFIHGDFKMDNCLLRLEEVPGGSSAWSGMYQPTGEGGWKHKGVKMIDFGRTIDTRMYPAGQHFIADWKTDVGDCLEMRENRPWTYETDYYGLAGIVYCMLFGKYFDAATVVPVPSAEPTRYKIAPQFKRYWQAELWARLFDVLLNPTLVRPDGSLPLVPELASLRDEMETWLASNCNRSSNTLKGLLKKVERSVLSSSSSK
ncbi:hypothetical protein DFH11DRAFT_874089 [Phellopilus nigrolimitatus]|nr:hypothetical protein DFH11DRAFT_874089 [Phellopilus nigrolimitatus]